MLLSLLYCIMFIEIQYQKYNICINKPRIGARHKLPLEQNTSPEKVLLLQLNDSNDMRSH